MNIYNTFRHLIITVSLFVLAVFHSMAQLPTGIDPGQGDNSVNIYEQPKYIIPILTLFVILIGYYFWRKRNKE